MREMVRAQTRRRRMPGAARRVAMAVGCIVLAGAAPGSRAERDALPPRSDTNVDYAYEVRLPRGLRIETNRAPNPNHGFGVTIAPAAKAWVDATYATTDPATLAAEVARLHEYRRQDGCTETGHASRRLGGRRAVELAWTCPSRSHTARQTTQRVILTVRRPSGHGPIVYQAGVEYPRGSRTHAEAERVYRALTDGFSFTASRP